MAAGQNPRSLIKPMTGRHSVGQRKTAGCMTTPC